MLRTVGPDQMVVFDFPLDAVTVERAGDDLVLSFGDGAETVLQGMFAPGAAGLLPCFELADGSVITGAQLLESLEECDLATALAPAAHADEGGGEYQPNDAGNIVAGVARLDGLALATGVGSSSEHSASATFGVASSIPGKGDGITDGNHPGDGSGEGPDNGGSGGDNGDSGGGDAGTPEEPYVYVKAGLLGADGNHDPVVKVALLTPDGEKMSAPFPESVKVSGNESYDVRYDSENGTLIITLKDSSAGAAPTENVVIEINGKSYIIQVGSTQSNDLADIEWAPVDEGVTFAHTTWAGSVDNHLEGGMTFVRDQDGNVTLTTPDGYEHTELHLQLGKSSLVSTDEKSVSVDLNLKEGSFTLANDGQSVLRVDHADPVDNAGDYYWSEGDYDTSATAYTATVTTALGALGPEALATVNVNGGDVFIHADGGAADSGNGNPVYASGVFAGNGGTATVKGDSVTVSTAAGGYASTGTVTGLRAHGASLDEEGNGWSSSGVSKNSEVQVQADKDVSVTVTVSGAPGEDHSGTAYAGLAATERGQISIQAGGDISVTAENKAEGSVNAGGVYGIYSGFGLGINDLPTLEDFRDACPGLNWGDKNLDGLNEYEYNQYMQALVYQYQNDRGYGWSEEEQPHNQSKVTLDAAGDVKVGVDLGSADFAGSASGIRAVMGDVDISAGGDITVDVTHTGNYGRGGGLSAMSLAHANVSVRAEGDLGLAVKGNGNDISVVQYTPLVQASGSYGFTHLAGKTVTLAGEAGYGGGPDNSVTGINASGTNFKKEAFTISADEKATLDVTAFHNGGQTSATGIDLSRAEAYYTSSKHDLTVAVDAPVFEINATVVGDVSQGSSTATGIMVTDGSSLGMYSFDSVDELKNSDFPLYEGKTVKPIEDLRINVQGARDNVGVSVTKNSPDWDSNARADIRAANMSVKVSGGNATDGSSYGLQAWDNSDGYGYSDGAKINIETGNLTVTVDDANHSVGLSARGPGAGIVIGSVREYDEYWNVQSSPLTVVISCTVTNRDGQFNGIALEALRGGNISIISAQRESSAVQQGLDDSITINGDIVAGNQRPDEGYSGTSRIEFDTAHGDDRVMINGDIKIGKNGEFLVNLGEGDDYFSLTGGVSVKQGGSLYIDAGAGDDVIILDGKVDLGWTVDEHGNRYSGSFYLSGGEGNDLLILKAPDAWTFGEWYREWLERDGTLAELQCETIVVEGVESADGLEWLVDLINNHGDIDFMIVPQAASVGIDNAFSSESGLHWSGEGLDDVDELMGQDNAHVSLSQTQGAENLQEFGGLVFDGTHIQSLDALLNGEGLEAFRGSTAKGDAGFVSPPEGGSAHETQPSPDHASPDHTSPDHTNSVWTGPDRTGGGEITVIQAAEYQAVTTDAEDQLYYQLMHNG